MVLIASQFLVIAYLLLVIEYLILTSFSTVYTYCSNIEGIERSDVVNGLLLSVYPSRLIVPAVKDKIKGYNVDGFNGQCFHVFIFALLSLYVT